MAQLERAPSRADPWRAGIVAMVAVAIIALTIVLGMLIPSRVSFPGSQQDGISAPNPALVQAEREWQRQREQQGGYVDPLTQAEREWEQQRQQQSASDGQ
jgi:NAD/NADP transhydrogenase alpha subunit